MRNTSVIPAHDLPAYLPAAFRDWIVERTMKDCRIASYFGMPADHGVHLFAVMADDAAGTLDVARTIVREDAFESATADSPQANLFEREIAEQFGITPKGHPWLKPVRFHHSYRPGHDAWGRSQDAGIAPGVVDFFRVNGEEVHEVAVGPVHAGVIEPGHFRFQSQGEEVLHLEIVLGYQHRGVERALIGGPTKRTIPYMETAAGDTTVGHALAYCQAMESLARATVPARAQVIRAVALELERLANHTGDLGALSGDVAFLPTASYCGRLRGDFLNMTASLCGSRFGRGLVRPGGVLFDITEHQAQELSEQLAHAANESTEAIQLLWDTPSVANRFENTGRISRDDAAEVGLVGPAARACGLVRDVRHDFPTGIYRFTHVPVMTAHHGDVNSRAFVRWLEIQQSIEFTLEQLSALPKSQTMTSVGPLAPHSVCVSLTEGWRGEICHVAVTDQDGRFARYKITDPSFHNWFGLALALRGQQISDFPLCNKSFNLSYCGHDL